MRVWLGALLMLIATASAEAHLLTPLERCIGIHLGDGRHAHNRPTNAVRMPSFLQPEWQPAPRPELMHHQRTGAARGGQKGS